jgi:hypothetical protein
MGPLIAGTERWDAFKAWSLSRKVLVWGGAAFCYWWVQRLIDRLIDWIIGLIDSVESTFSSQCDPPSLVSLPFSRYSYTGLVSSAKHKTSTSTYVDLLGLTMITQLASVFFDAAWLLLLLVRTARSCDRSVLCMSLCPFIHCYLSNP